MAQAPTATAKVGRWTTAAAIAAASMPCEASRRMGTVILLVWVAVVVIGLTLSARRRRRGLGRRNR